MKPKKPKPPAGYRLRAPDIPRLDSRDAILDYIHRIADIAEKLCDVQGAVGAAKAAATVVQMIDPTAPEQELGAFRISVVGGKPRPLPPIESDGRVPDAE